MALLCRPLCWGRATVYVHHKPHRAPLGGRACSQSPEHTLTCMVFSHFAIYLKFMHVEHTKKFLLLQNMAKRLKKKIYYCTLVAIEINFIMHVEPLIILVKLQFKPILHVFL